MNSLKYFIVILLIGAQFGTILTQDDAPPPPEGGDDAPPPPDGGDDATPAPDGGDETTAAPDGGDETTAAPDGGDETTAAPDGGDETTAAPAGGDETTAAPTTAAPKPTTPKTTKAPVKTTPKPTTPVKCRACYRNPNGICRTFDIACTKKGLNLRDKNGIRWTLSEGDCANRSPNQPKVCSSDCPRFKTANCKAAPTPVCGYSKNRKVCRKYPSLCHLKKNACNNPNIGDWGVAPLTKCRGLKVGAAAVPC